ncbi:PadR family transcriptional regulator [Oryzifoliimicrobium ureilyticus]|uniref:PadR family transcriptional regulator n=1 Tax=Oryzifoliimicrobium ureilyticus TaxID=3113724 RepID=UPI0030766EFF
MRGFRDGILGGGLRMGRKLAAGDLQLVILALLEEQPRHGYELIKLLEERSGGFYVPSPGVIYPALTYLEETGLADVENDGAKKLYRITDDGRKKLDEDRAAIELVMRKLEQIGQKMAQMRRMFEKQRGDEFAEDSFSRESDNVTAAYGLLKSALRLRQPWSKDEAARIAAILEKAATDILNGSRRKDEE